MNLRSASPLLATALLTAALSLGFAAEGSARSSDRNQPMEVDADGTEGDLSDNGDSVLRGNVRIVQGSLDVRADRAVITRVNGEITRVVLEGSPVRLKQVADNGDPIDAVANKVVYTLDSEVMDLRGAVSVKQPRGSLNGETVKYNMRTNHLNAGGDGTRIKLIIAPKNKATP